MLDCDVMTGMLEKYDSFLTDFAVSALRQMDGNNAKVEAKLVEFLRGRMFPVSVECMTDYLAKIPRGNVREQVVNNLREMHATLMDMIAFISAEDSRQSVYLPLIRMMEKENHPHRSLAMTTLCCFDFPEAVNNLALCFSEFASEMRWVTLVLLKKRWDEKFVPVFIKALEDHDPEVVRIAILALMRANVISALLPIRQLLRNSSELIVLAAISALVELGASDSLAELNDLYKTTDNNQIKASIVSAFGELDGAETVAFLATCLDASDSRVRANAIIALKRKYEKQVAISADVIQRISALKNDGNHRVQADSIHTLWVMGHTESAADIEKMLFSDNEFTRSAGAYLIGKLKLYQLKKHLEVLTADASWSTRKMAAIALLAFGESGKLTLKHLMNHGNSDQQIISAFASGLADDSAAIEKLIEQSRSGGEIAEMAISLLLEIARTPS
ncbi:MAG: HEAT repeat domain-containing protein [Erysipelotrichia bacterium]|nr:HEAT repeat domain-containing protein [Erysipelotrichia bacterium]